RTLAGLTAALRQRHRTVAVFVDYPQHFVPAAPDSAAALPVPEVQLAMEYLHRWGLDDAIRESENLVILLAPEGAIHGLLTESGAYRLIRAGLPAQDDRRRFLALLAALRAKGRNEFGDLEEGLSLERAAAL